MLSPSTPSVHCLFCFSFLLSFSFYKMFFFQTSFLLQLPIAITILHSFLLKVTSVFVFVSISLQLLIPLFFLILFLFFDTFSKSFESKFHLLLLLNPNIVISFLFVSAVPYNTVHFPIFISSSCTSTFLKLFFYPVFPLLFSLTFFLLHLHFCLSFPTTSYYQFSFPPYSLCFSIIFFFSLLSNKVFLLILRLLLLH